MPIGRYPPSSLFHGRWASSSLLFLSLFLLSPTSGFVIQTMLEKVRDEKREKSKEEEKERQQRRKNHQRFVCVLQISCSFSFVLGLRLGLEQAGNPFCLLINSSWLLVFISLFYLLLMGLNLYWWKGIHFS